MFVYLLIYLNASPVVKEATFNSKTDREVVCSTNKSRSNNWCSRACGIRREVSVAVVLGVGAGEQKYLTK